MPLQTVPACPLLCHPLQRPAILPCVTSPFHYITSCLPIAWSECHDAYLARHVFCVCMHVSLGDLRLFACPITWTGTCLSHDNGICAFGESDRYIKVDTVHVTSNILANKYGWWQVPAVWLQNGCIFGYVTGMSCSVQESHNFMRQLLSWKVGHPCSKLLMTSSLQITGICVITIPFLKCCLRLEIQLMKKKCCYLRPD